MTKIVNQIVPYNDIWLDCFSNNLISTLISRSETSRMLPLAMEASYIKMLTDQHYDSENDRRTMLTGGNLFPTVEYSSDIIKDHFEIRYKEYQEYKEIIESLKSSLADGLSTFLMIDRYFYPSGREAGTLHLAHSVFILGYDDDKNMFHAIEDCVTLGVLSYYDIPYESVERSCQYFLKQGRPLLLTTCRPLELSLHNIAENTKDAAMKMIANLFDETTSYNTQYNLHYYSGLKALRKFQEEMDYLFTHLSEMSLSFVALFLLRFPQLHGRNQQLVRFLNESGYLHDSDYSALVENYKLLQLHWTNYKNRSYYFFEKRGSEAGKNSELILSLSKRLVEIIELELATAQKFKNAMI